MQDLLDVEIDFAPLLAVRPMILAMTGITPANDEEEREAILTALDHNYKINSFLYENLPEETEFYVLEKKFWDQWCTSMNFNGNAKYSIKKEHKAFIDNKQLMEEMHEHRMKDVAY